MTEDQLIAIMLADHERYQTRQAREDALLSNDDESRAALADWTQETPLKRGTGLIPLSDTRRKTPRRAPRTTSHGAAAMPQSQEQCENLANGLIEDSVLVTYADGTQAIKTVSEIRSKGKTSKNRAPSTQPRTADTARFNTGHDFNN